MVATAATVLAGAALMAWHLQRMRRHPGWSHSPDGRFCITTGYPMVAIGGYWLVAAPTATSWEWAIGNAWVLGACLLFVRGSYVLDNADTDTEAAASTDRRGGTPAARTPGTRRIRHGR